MDVQPVSRVRVLLASGVGLVGRIVGAGLMCLFASTTLAGSLSAQIELRILVVDSLTSTPIPGALIELATLDGEAIWSGTADSEGQATVTVRPGMLTVFSLMPGYRPVGPVEIEIPDQDWIRLRLLMAASPIALDSLDVRVRSRLPHARDRWGFEFRRKYRPYAVFLERSDTRLKTAAFLSRVLRAYTGITVELDRYGGALLYMRESSILRKFNGLVRNCGPRVVLDGMTIHEGGPGAPAPIDELVRADQIAALEIYRSGAEVPIEFKFGPDTCGAVVIWTR